MSPARSTPLAPARDVCHSGNHMVTTASATLDAVFTALAHPTRRAILSRLTRDDATVGELAEPFAMSRPAISKHLDVLERAGLVHRVSEGRVNRCHFDGEPLAQAMALMARYQTHWDRHFNAIARYLDQEKKP